MRARLAARVCESGIAWDWALVGAIRDDPAISISAITADRVKPEGVDEGTVMPVILAIEGPAGMSGSHGRFDWM